MLGELPATGLTTITSTRGVATTTELTLVSEALAVFETAYYLVTGATPRQDGWVPRVLSTEEYFRLIDEKAGGDPELKAALAFCCPPADGLLEVIVDGGSPSQSVIGSLAHEAGHARQRLSNPAQDDAPRDTNLGALKEAQAYAFESALLRALGRYAEVNAITVPAHPATFRLFNAWDRLWRASTHDLTEEHVRGVLLMWLAVIHDPALKELKTELDSSDALSPESLLKLHGYLVGLTPGEASSYVVDLLDTDLETSLRAIRAKLNDRTGNVQLERLIVYNSEIVDYSVGCCRQGRIDRRRPRTEKK